ncbi:cAMP-regulated phosphoprotein 21-like isoform X3 [Gigantopelta aegis]|uniref:cAMP-regulated phosphoprotein 21-like isoform X3 n=1 Tax=Gigantopelta aegis TaxID=1735272 RepID=UPI001B88CDCB|nr:cAMP-regulated phosphoprotein 21-like isoform X3 [Gigantopelta aegis]
MTMATELDRRAGKLKKQPEIEEIEEEADINGSPSSDTSDHTITASAEPPTQSNDDTPVLNEQSRNSPASLGQPVQANHFPVRTRSLVRGEALCDDCSPPPEDNAGIDETRDRTICGENTNFLTVCPKLEKSGSQGSEAGTSSSISRESSLDNQYKDSTGIDLEEFIKKTLNKSVKDRKMLLQLAKDLKKFIREPKHQFFQFDEMSSYDRMLVHRVAAFFGLDHNVDQSGKSVIVSKTKITRIPDFSFEDQVLKGDQPLKKKILPRKAPSLDERESKGREKHLFGSNRAKSLEERQKSYEETRARIFKNGEQGEELLGCPLLSLVSSKDDLGSRQPSTDSSGYGSSDNNRSRIGIHKSNSYGGRPAIPPMKLQHGTCSLSKADSISSGSFESPPIRPFPVPTSPCQSDQSSLSRSNSVGPVASPISSGGPPPSQGSRGQGSSYPILVTTDPGSIPVGSMIVNPQTLQPHMNADGTMYRYDPAQPPPWLMGGNLAVPPQNMQAFPACPQHQYPGDQHELCQRFPSMTMSGQSPDMMAEMLPPTPQGSQMLPGNQPMYNQNPHPYLQSYYPAPNCNTGQPVRYIYQVPYPGQQLQAPVDGQGQTQAVAGMGQYQQHYVHSVPSNYPNVVLQSGPSGDLTAAAGNHTAQTAVYPGAVHPGDGNVQSYSIQYGNFSQNSCYGQSPSPVFYSVSSSNNPQMGFSLGGPGTQLRATTPPNQAGPVAAPNPTTLNVGQAMNYGSGSTHAAHSLTSPQFGSYPVYPQVVQNQLRPVNQVVHIPGVQSHSPSQHFSVVRQVSMPVVGLQGPPQGTALGPPQPMGMKGYTVHGCVQKQSVEPGKEGTAIMPAISHVPGSSPVTGPAIRTPQQIGSNDVRMMNTAGYRPQQLQTLQFSVPPVTPPHPQPLATRK